MLREEESTAVVLWGVNAWLPSSTTAYRVKLRPIRVRCGPSSPELRPATTPPLARSSRAEPHQFWQAPPSFGRPAMADSSGAARPATAAGSALRSSRHLACQVCSVDLADLKDYYKVTMPCELLSSCC